MARSKRTTEQSSHQLAIALVLFGLAVLVASFLWPRLVSDDQVWSKQQARDHARASANLHKMTHEAAEAQLNTSPGNEPHRKRMEAELNEAKASYQSSRAALDRAQRTRHTAATVMRWTGIAFVLAGIGQYLAVRSSARG